MYEVAEIDSEKVMGGEDSNATENRDDAEQPGNIEAPTSAVFEETSNAASCKDVVPEELQEDESNPQENNKKPQQAKQRHYKLFNRFGKRKITVSSSTKTKENEEEEVKEQIQDNNEEFSLSRITETSKEEVKETPADEEIAKDEENETPPPLPPKRNRFKWKRTGIPVKVAITSAEEEEVVNNGAEHENVQPEKEESLEDSEPHQDTENEESKPPGSPGDQQADSEEPQSSKNEATASAGGVGKRKFSRKIPRSIRMRRKNKAVVQEASDTQEAVEDGNDQTTSKQGTEKRKKFHWKRFSMLAASKELEEQNQGNTAGECEIPKDDESSILTGEETDVCEITNVVDQNAQQEDAEVSAESQNQDYQTESPDQSNEVDDTLEASSLTHVTQMLEKEENTTEKHGCDGKNPFMTDGNSSPDVESLDKVDKGVEIKEEDSQIDQEESTTSENDEEKANKTTDFILVDPYTEKPKDDSFYLTKKALRVYQKAQLSQNYCQACCTMM
ncbi:enolase-phosphatase E1-like [Clytia hemisphaerica]|uniref:enolase-phosphatase E1-like n=1 Tax=Clytia hemisphaerica TaxID=252671 RepID=UPI0034D4072A